MRDDPHEGSTLTEALRQILIHQKLTTERDEVRLSFLQSLLADLVIKAASEYRVALVLLPDQVQHAQCAGFPIAFLFQK